MMGTVLPKGLGTSSFECGKLGDSKELLLSVSVGILMTLTGNACAQETRQKR